MRASESTGEERTRISGLPGGSSWVRACISLVCALLALVVLVDHADAQRRRRRRRTEEPTPTAEPTPETETEAASPDPSAAATATASPEAATGTPPPAAASTPAPTPAVAPPTPVADPGPLPPDLGPLRADWSTLMDDMVSARQRVATLGEELFRTRLAVTVQDRAGDDQVMTRFALELDGTPIFHTDTEITGDAGREVFQAALAPGPHVLTIELEQSARDGTEYRYTQRDSFRFIVVRDRRTEITVVLEDDSDIARSFGSGGEGRYEIRTRVRVATRALE